MTEENKAWPKWWCDLPNRLRKFTNNFLMSANPKKPLDNALNWDADCGDYGFKNLVGCYAEASLHYQRHGHISEDPNPEEARRPSMSELESMMMDSECYATDGCYVEPDGHCQHGKPSWLLQMGLI